MTRPLMLIAAATTTIVLGACTASAKPADAAKVAIDTIKKELGISVTCVPPPDTNVGTKFECSGVDANGTINKFSAEITKKDEVTVTQLDG